MGVGVSSLGMFSVREESGVRLEAYGRWKKRKRQEDGSNVKGVYW